MFIESVKFKKMIGFRVTHPYTPPREGTIGNHFFEFITHYKFIDKL